ncbi:MAG: 16S rRNA (guanine(527)-N(7))-methyltransferase RsmG [Desulfobulbus sp.]|uniref:16S rRNA (guanine(527)-N(7))-methyltransferase RsmG n=1 Tax=Desulfobulbus sp. TaxID=895 RepID=UPI00283FAEF0|nr:16S rRNA (guanine(527)-N(7))-methyltransferase RsmG [Desulfobulbus sp.]MDR2550172.1 16S rRNA (guanine(527)-N(7))-methyltransferase RsmG [Desulfobulbus sp.]
MAEDSRQLLAEGARALGIGLGAAAVDRLALYLAELMKWSRRVNLIARDTPELQAIDTHFLDALTLVPLLEEGGGALHLLDVGTGAGFPGLVLACVLPAARFTLVEPRQKRVSFLRHIVRTLDLDNVEVVADRIEPHAVAWHGRFTHLTSRAVAEPAAFLPLIRPLAAPATEVILMLARPEALVGLEHLPAGPWRLAISREFVLPFSGAPRLLAVVRCG